MSLDGVSESKSTSISLDVYSIQFDGCREIYPLKIVRALNKCHVNNEDQLSLVMSDVLANNLLLLAMIADNPKRAFLRKSLQHSAKFACEYCFVSGVLFKNSNEQERMKFIKDIEQQKKLIQEQIDKIEDSDAAELDSLRKIVQNLEEAHKLAKKQVRSSHIVWPSNTSGGELRTKEKILNIVDQIEAGEVLTLNDKKGIKGRSILLDIDYFDYVLSMPTEYMHSVCLGVVKRLIEITFGLGESRPKATKRTIASVETFNELILKVKMFKECSRRARKLDISVMKAQEMRNILILFFPIVTKCVDHSEKEVKLWEMLAFMIRACILPEHEYANVNVNQIKYCQKNFYPLYQQIFGERNCTYSIHVVISHLLQMRAPGPLTENSAFKFEAFYAELRHAFQPGTVSVIKQMLQNVLLKRLLSKHVCKEKIYLREKDTGLECNSLIYVYENSKYLVYKINSINDDILVCNQMGNHEIDLPQTAMLNWSSVGVFRKGGLSSIDVIINRKDVAGKVIKVENYLITCPNNVLREK